MSRWREPQLSPPQMGDKDHQGNLLVLGGGEVDILRTPSGTYIVGIFTSSHPRSALEAYNLLNQTSLREDYIESMFQPWFDRTVLGLGKGGTRVVARVPSRTDPSTSYIVRYDSNGNLTCNCRGFTYRGYCWHTDAVRDLQRGDN